MTARRQQIVDGDSAALLELDGAALDDDRVLGGPGGGEPSSTG